MKPEEAIKMLKYNSNVIHKTINGETDINEVEALDMAISALEKQIPKKVRITTSTKRCATCGRQLSGIGNIHPRRNYCQGCGQAIEWENK